MPIKGLTTQREPAFPRIGVLRKGGVKSEKRPGADLKHFRFDTDSPQAFKNFEAAYGKQPDTINVYLPYSTPDENFQAWQEEYKSGGLVHRCDGETMSVWLTPDGKYSTDPKPCPYHTGQAKRTTNEPGCKPVGRLTVIIPELQRFAYVTVGTTSKNDIMELTDNLNAVFAMRGNLQGIPFVLCRRPKMISTPTPDGGRARYEKWMLSLEVNPQWATMQLETMRKQAMLPSGVKLLTSGHAIQEDTGEIIEGVWEDDDTDDDNPFSDTPPTNGNGAKASNGTAHKAAQVQSTQIVVDAGKVQSFVSWALKTHGENERACSDAQYRYLVGTINAITGQDESHSVVLAKLTGRETTGENKVGANLASKLLDWLPATRKDNDTKEVIPNPDYKPEYAACVRELWKSQAVPA